MSTNLLTIVKQIISEYGEGILENPQRLKVFLNDLAKDEPKPMRIAFIGCLENGAYNALKTALDSSERASCKAVIAQRVRDEAGLDSVLCGEALDILEAALFVAAPTAVPTCKNCGKALQAEWKLCPYCGTATAGQQKIPSKPAVPASSLPSSSLKSESPPSAPAATFTPTPQTSPVAMPSKPAAPASSLPSRSLKPESPPIIGFVYIHGGTFTIGSLASEPNRSGNETQHDVTVSGFYMAQYEVTQAEYEAVMGSNPSYFKGANLPVEEVSWYDAVEYCNKRSEREGLKPAYTVIKNDVSWNRNANGYRLPTEAEWEYACRAGTTTPFSTGNNITTDQANYNGNYPYNNNAKGKNRKTTIPVGTFAPNDWGLYDMHGNVWEWCWDWYADYASGAQTDPGGAASGSYRIVRGGSWYDNARYLRSANRGINTPTNSYYYYGFRLVRP